MSEGNRLSFLAQAAAAASCSQQKHSSLLWISGASGPKAFLALQPKRADCSPFSLHPLGSPLSPGVETHLPQRERLYFMGLMGPGKQPVFSFVSRGRQPIISMPTCLCQTLQSLSCFQNFWPDCTIVRKCNLENNTKKIVRS